MTDIPVEISLSGKFIPAKETELSDFREFFRALSADLGYDSQLEPSNDFSWAFHDAIFTRAHPHSTEDIVTVSASIAGAHPRALVPLIFWICYALEMLGEFNLNAISLCFPQRYPDVPLERALRHLQPLPRTIPSHFSLDIEVPACCGGEALDDLIERISQLPYPSFKIDSAVPVCIPVTSSDSSDGRKWQLEGRIRSWDYLEISYLLYTFQTLIPAALKTSLVRK